MNRLVLVAVILSVGFASCDKETPALTKAQIQHQVDSIAAARIKEADARVEKDLQYRMKIELKGRVDSIINARQQAMDTTHPKDTATHPNAPAQ